MARRTRLTWTQPATSKAAKARTASPPPQTPSVGRTEGPDHPAFYPDPDRDKYEKGDTSSWAEDPKSPMIPESAPPAMPGNLTTEPLDHPATSDFEKGADKPEKPPGVKEASLKELAERRATLCIRIASAMMKGATTAAVEDKALELMDLDDAQLRAAAAAIKLVAGEDPLEEKKDDEEKDEAADKEASDKSANIEITARIDRIEKHLGKLRKAMATFFGMDDKEDAADQMMAYLMGKDEDGDGIDQSKNDFPQGYDIDKLSEKEDDEDAMLKAMLDEMDEEMKTATHEQDVTEPLAKGQSIQSGEGGNVNPDAAPKTPQVAGPQTGGTAVKAGEMPDFIKEKMDEKKDDDEKDDDGDKTAAEDDEKSKEDTDNDIEVTAAGDDPMGLMSDVTASDDELMQLYADLEFPRTAGEEEVEEEVAEDGDGDVEEAEAVEDKTAARKTASAKPAKKATVGKPQLRPQAKTAATGAAPKQLGNVSRQAREIDDLSKLWGSLSAPDVSDVFGVPKP